MTTQTDDLYGDAVRRHAHQISARMRAEAPVFQQAGLDGQTPIWFVTGAAEVEQVLLDSQIFARDPALISEELAAAFQTPTHACAPSPTTICSIAMATITAGCARS